MGPAATLASARCLNIISAAGLVPHHALLRPELLDREAQAAATAGTVEAFAGALCTRSVPAAGTQRRSRPRQGCRCSSLSLSAAAASPSRCSPAGAGSRRGALSPGTERPRELRWRQARPAGPARTGRRGPRSVSRCPQQRRQPGARAGSRACWWLGDTGARRSAAPLRGGGAGSVQVMPSHLLSPLSWHRRVSPRQRRSWAAARSGAAAQGCAGLVAEGARRSREEPVPPWGRGPAGLRRISAAGARPRHRDGAPLRFATLRPTRNLRAGYGRHRGLPGGHRPGRKLPVERKRDRKWSSAASGVAREDGDHSGAAAPVP